ncbi:MAG: CCA tRNA nucleotidyltransferase [Ignavibacteria bacterium]|nr:CCA tRNA nucleotidyltransferase [Ignavibacteria bacterium]
MPNRKLKIENPVLINIGKLADRENTEAYVVGGYVRDALLGKEAEEIDVMVVGDGTSFAEAVALEYGKKPEAVYRNFGTALVMIDGMKTEFASARKESYRKDSRNPEIETATLEEDLSRRDFTVNALAVSLNKKSFGKITDLFGGLKDLEARTLRTPLDPEKTFEDDPLRIMRALRFASRFGFNIDPDALKAMNKMAHRLSEGVVSQERITNEFLLILDTPKPSTGLSLMFLSGVMDHVFPEISGLEGVEQKQEYHHKDVFRHTLTVVDNIAAVTDDIWLRFAALVHDIAKPMTKKFVEGEGWTFHGHEEMGARMMNSLFRRMRLPMNKLPYVEKLVRMHLRPIPLAKEEVTDSAIRRLAADAGEDLEDLLKLCRADITSKNPKKVEKYLKNFGIVEKRVIEVAEKDKLRNFQSPVRGEEIMKICGLRPSRTVGMLKKRIEDAILDGLIPNEYEDALKYLYQIKDEVISVPSKD